MRALALIALLLFTGSTQGAPLLDLVQNGGFEAWDEGAPAGWTAVRVAQGSPSAGTWSALLLPDSAPAALAQAVPIAAIPGQAYSLGFDAAPSTGSDATASIWWLGPAGEITYAGTLDVPDSAAFQRHTLRVNAPLGVPPTYALLVFEAYGAPAHIDEVAFGPTLD